MNLELQLMEWCSDLPCMKRCLLITSSSLFFHFLSSAFLRREGVVVERFYYALTWTCRFPVSGDTCYFAHCFPYTYSDLKAGSTHTDTHPHRHKQRTW